MSWTPGPNVTTERKSGERPRPERRATQRVDEPDPIVVRHLDREVQDIDGLLALYRHPAR